MSFDLSSLRFTVETKQLDDATTKVGALATAVAALNKPLGKLGDGAKSTTKDIDRTTKAVDENSTVIKKNQTVLERQESILKFMSDGYSKGQSSILAMGKASGLADTELQKLGDTIDRQRKLQGSEPFDKSIGAIKVLKNELGALREAYRQTIKAQSAESEGATFAVLSTKQSKDLYREKFRLIEQFKDQSNTELTTYAQLKAQLRSLNTDYLSAAKARNTLAGVDTIQQTKRRDQLQYLARATSVQLGDIGVSLAGGQNPLTVLIQQADQMRGIFAQVGANGEEMKAGLSSAFKQIVVGFKDVVLVLGQFVLGAIVDSGKALVKFALDITHVTSVLDTLRGQLVKWTGESSNIVKVFDKIGAVAGGAMALGIGAGIVALLGLAVAYKEVISTSHDLSVALSMSGAAIAITKNEALAMSSTLAGGVGTSMDFAKAITEIAKAGNLSKETIGGIATVALEFQKYAGIAVKDTVAGYSKLAEDPVKALTELGAATGRVTLAQIEEVKGLVEVGKQHEAVAEAIRLKQESDSQAIAIQKGDLSDIERLFHEVKDAIKLVKEEFYSVIQNGANVEALTTAWRTIAVIISEVGFVLKGVGKEIGGVAAQAAAIVSGDFAAASRIGDMMKSDAQAARKSQDEYTKSIIDGTTAKSKQVEIDLKGNKATRESIEAYSKQEALKSKFGANSKLTDDARKKELEKYTAQIKANAEIMKSAKGANVADINKDTENLLSAAKSHFKDKKPTGQAGAIRDTLSAKQQEIENDRNKSVRSAKMAMDAINSEHKRGLVNDYDYATQKASIEQKALNDSIGFYTKEIEIAKKKVNSKKEVETLEGKIKKAKDDIKDKELEKQYAQLEFTQKLRDAVSEEIKALDDKSKAQKLDNELIGKSAEQVTAIKAARLDNVIALQKEHVEYMAKNGYSESSSSAYALEKAKLDALIESRKLNTDALSAEIAATIAKNNAASSEAFNKDMLGTDKTQRDLAFREKLLGKTQEQKDAMKRAYDLENQLEEVKLKKQEGINQAAAEYNRLLSMIPEGDYATKAADIAKIKASYDLQIDRVTELGNKQEELIKKGANIAEKELNDAKLEKFSEGVADALVTGMTQGAKAGKKKLRDLIVAELTKTITLNITANVKSLLSGGGLTGGSGGGLFDKLLNKGFDYLSEGLFGASSAGIGSGVAYGGVAGGAAVSTTSITAIDAASAGVTTLAEASSLAAPALASAAGGIGGMGSAALAALGPVGLLAVGATALFAIFGFGKDKIPTVLNDLALFTNSLIGLPFLDVALGSDEAAQGLRDVLYGLDNASPTMKKLAGETISLSIELLRATGDIAGAANLARNLGTRGMSEAEIAVYDYNEGLKQQIEAARAGQHAAQAAAQAEEQLAKTRYSLAGKIDVLLGRKTQLEVDRAASLVDVTDEAVISLTKMVWVLEDLHSAIDKAFAGIQRAVEAERKSITESYKTATDANKAATDTHTEALKSATDLLGSLTTASKTISGGLTRAQAKAQLDTTLNMARMTGMLPTADSMKDILDALTQNGESSFKTAADYKLDQAKNAAKVSELARMAGNQVSIEQRTLDELKIASDLLKTTYEAEMKRLDDVLSNAQKQLDKLNGIDTSVISVADAVKAFDKSLAALAAAVKAAPANTTPAPSGSSNTSGGGGGGSTSGGGSALPTYEDIAGQDNKDIVRAYREYYSRNPDATGYKAFIESKLTGDKLMQTILGASAANPEGDDYKNAIKKGYDPLDPLKKFLKSKTVAPVEEGAFAVGINNVPYDMTARIHKGERILPAADNRELFARLQSPSDNSEVLTTEIRRLGTKLEEVTKELTQIKESNKKMKDIAEKSEAIGAPPTREVL